MKRVVCINKEGWILLVGPKFNEVCTVVEICTSQHGASYRFAEYPQIFLGLQIDYHVRFFQDLITDSELESLLNSVPETQTVEV